MPPDQQRAEHDQHRRAGADLAGQRRVEHGHRRGAGDQQGDQAQRVGDDVAGAHRQPVAEEHADRSRRAGPSRRSRRCRYRRSRGSSVRDGGAERSLARDVALSGAPGARRAVLLAWKVHEDMKPMSRSLVSLRCALPSDAHVLAELWSDRAAPGRAGGPGRRPARRSSRRAAASDHERLVVAEYDGEVAGAVHLRVTTLTPINLERVVQAVSPHVLPQLPPPRRRPGADGRRGVVRRGARRRARRDRRRLRAPGTPTASWPASRSARGPCCGSPRPRCVRAKLTAQRPAVHRRRRPPAPQVLAARRSMRRSARLRRPRANRQRLSRPPGLSPGSARGGAACR